MLSLPGFVLMQVKLETLSTGISAVCQLAVNIYCFSCCEASSQNVRRMTALMT